MMTPYDWQEAIGHRAQYVESRLAHATPAVAVSIDAGILMLGYRRTVRKLYEVYDQLGMASMGQQSDVEMIRMMAIDFAHQEGYSRSERDVTVQRVIHAISGPVKRAFADFSSAPVIARAVFAEVGDDPSGDHYVMLDYDGDFHGRRNYGYVAPTQGTADRIEAALNASHLLTASVDTAIKELDEIWRAGLEPHLEHDDDGDRNPLVREVALLERGNIHQTRFRYLSADDFVL